MGTEIILNTDAGNYEGIASIRLELFEQTDKGSFYIDGIQGCLVRMSDNKQLILLQ